MPIYTIVQDEEERQFSVETVGEGRYAIAPLDAEGVRGAVIEVDAYSPEQDVLNLLVGGRSADATLNARNGEVFAVEVEGAMHDVEVLNERQRRMRVAGVGGSRALGPDLTSPMAGRVVKIAATVDQAVEVGEVVVVVEAMKMENDLKAHIEGTVETIAVEEGQTVEVGDLLLRITPAEG